MASKSILKKRTNELSKTSKQTDGIEWLKKNKINTSTKKEKQEEMSMKIFTVTTKSLIYYSKKFADKSAMKSVQVGSYLFEIIGKLTTKFYKAKSNIFIQQFMQLNLIVPLCLTRTNCQKNLQLKIVSIGSNVFSTRL